MEPPINDGLHLRSKHTCSVKGCIDLATDDVPFFYDKDKPEGIGLEFQMCKAHAEYYMKLISLCDSAIVLAHVHGRWPEHVPKFQGK